jgi:ABC-type bacteriocin/lantibiotic exporter with double-glycine peptidase domain
VPSFLKKLYFILPSEDLFRIGRLSILLTIVAVMEVFGLGLISFLLINIENLNDAIGSIDFMPSFMAFLNISSIHYTFVFCTFVVLYSIITLIASVLIIRSLNVSGQFIGSRIRQKILNYYLEEDWLNLAHIKTSEQVSKIINDGRQVGFVIIFSLHLFSRLILCFFIIAGLFIYDPALTLLVVSILLISYTFITFLISPLIKKHGANTAKMMNESLKILNNIFSSVKEIIFYDAKSKFISNFKKTDSNLVYAEAHNAFYSQIPRFLIDSVILIILVLVIAFFSASEFDSQKVFASISIFGLAGLKVLPSFQNIYYFYYEIIFRQLQLSNVFDIFQALESFETNQDNLDVPLDHSITLQNVSFNYGDDRPTLEDISLKFYRDEKILIVGPSGSGKSTLLDLILGFTFPQSGQIIFDKTEINMKDRAPIRKNFAFVPQKVLLIEGSLRENILFGTNLTNNNEDFFQRVLYLSKLDEVVDKLPNGLDTIISESNQVLSGGQKQCIGFARAFFKKRDVLVLDEATNAMDRQLEIDLMSNISNLNYKMIIAISHKSSLLEYFDKTCVLKNGKIQDYDLTENLLSNNKFLIKMVDKN